MLCNQSKGFWSVEETWVYPVTECELLIYHFVYEENGDEVFSSPFSPCSTDV